MSLPKLDTQGTLFGSVQMVAGELFEEENRYRIFAEKIYPSVLGTREELAECYCLENGRPGVEPVMLMGILLLQFMEGVPDRKAMELLQLHLGWKYALNVDIKQKASDATTLVVFRKRLIRHKKSMVIFDRVVEALIKEGLVSKGGKQRIDSTHVIGMVAKMSRLECVREAMRLALKELEKKVRAEERGEFWSVYWERYVESKLDYKSGEEVLKTKFEEMGSDVKGLLEWVEATRSEEEMEGKQVKLLREIFEQQYEVEEKSEEVTSVKEKKQEGGIIQNPHEEEAQWSCKGKGKSKKEWVGYKVQVAESVNSEQAVEKGEPTRNFITSIVTQDAIESDIAGLEAALERQEEKGIEKPQELYADAGYVSAAILVEAQKEGREVVGPASASPGTQNKGYRAEDFDICVEERRAVCPAGKESKQCSELYEAKTGKISYRFEWGAHCRECPLRGQCIKGNQQHRTVVVGEHHSALQERRREQQTPEFKRRMRARNGIEGSISELVRGHRMRRARYRGKAKVDLQNQFIAAACNVKRWINRIVWEMNSATSQQGAQMPTPAFS